MKKLVALLLAAMMLCANVVALAETPEGYPEIKEGIDFGGQTIYIYDFWTSESQAARKDDPNEEEQAQYDYRDYIMEKLNCNIIQIQKGGWDTNVQELINYNAAPDGTLCLYILPPDFVGSPMANNQFAQLNTEGSLVDWSAEKWNTGVSEFMTVDGKLYGVYAGKDEPRQGLYFNKRVLTEAGIDWETIYDMQKEGTWTWDVLEGMLKQIQKDVDNDGVTDIYGITGNNTDFALISVFSNGASFFDFDENGDLYASINSDAGLAALTYAKNIWNTYSAPQPEGTDWNFFEDYFELGTTGFCCHQSYAGFGDGAVYSDMEDDWGWVAMPKGPNGTGYTHIATNNVTVIPSAIDAETAVKLAYVFDLWSNPTPGYDNEEDWSLQYYSRVSDERMVDETYAMLRETGVMNKNLYLGSTNDVLGQDFLWNLFGSDPATIIEAKTPAWDGLLATFNAD